jgi:hypothetical protein
LFFDHFDHASRSKVIKKTLEKSKLKTGLSLTNNRAFYLDPNSIPSKNRPRKKIEVMDLVVTSALARSVTAVFERVSVKLEKSNFTSMCVLVF